jgi:hypothetical protein
MREGEAHNQRKKGQGQDDVTDRALRQPVVVQMVLIRAFQSCAFF